MSKHIAFAGIIVDFEVDESMSEAQKASVARQQFKDKVFAGKIEIWDIGVTDIRLHPDEEGGR